MTSQRKRRTQITIETRKLTIIRTSVRKNDLTGCQHCGENVSSIPDLHAAIAFGIDADQITALTKTGSIHRVADGTLCGSSLAAHYNGQSGIDDGYTTIETIE